MVLVQVLKRKDASSVVVAVVVAMVLYQVVQTIPAKWAGWLSGLQDGQYTTYTNGNTDWKGQYLYPIVFAILELLVLEVVVRLYVWAVSMNSK
jgi:flagellar biosynthesis protein FlhB